ncbi:MAG: recombinase RecJ, partial [Ruminococcus sp.]|nr:recombinase RecJ [Ruminococcus sp.]
MKLNDLLSFDNIIVQCHDYPDADTIASGYGLYCFLKSHNKKVRLIYSGTNQIAKPSLLIMVERLGIPIQYVKELSEKPQLLITADCVHGEKNVTDFDAHCYAAVDHHISVKNSSGLYEIRPEYASCSSIISVMLREAGYDFNDNRPLATSLYYGLFTDSNGMSEINHPADRDLRDFTVYDKELIMLLTNSVLTLDELKLAAEALNNVINDDRYHFAVTCARECDPNILGYINDLVLQVDTVDVSIVCCFISGGIKISVRSCISDIKAQELAKYITDTIGSGGGQNQKAGGFISSESVPHINAENIFSFIREKVKKYYRSFDVIRAEDFSADPSRMEVYIKKPQLLG